MKNHNHTIAKILTLIPVIILALTVICLGLAMWLQALSGRGTLYTILGGVGLVSMFLSPLPCLIMSVFGTVYASKAVKEGANQTRKFLILGIVEILIHVLCGILAISMFIAGMGV